MITETDRGHLRAAIEASRTARDGGNAPYGAVLVDARGETLLTVENSEVTTRDCTAHAEASLVRQASVRFGRETLQASTLYASGEPCAMCAGAIYNAGIGRLVFALGQPRMYALSGDSGGIRLRAAEVLAHGQPQVVVEGPELEDEAAAVLQGR